MIKIIRLEDRLLLRYTPERSSIDWVDQNLSQREAVTFRHTFTFSPEALVTKDELDSIFVDEEGFAYDIWDEDERGFVLAKVDDNYFRINKAILGLKHDLLISQHIAIDVKTFIAYRDISIFRKLDHLVSDPIVVGGEAEGVIPAVEFAELLRNFPTSTELKHYSHARIERVLRDSLGSMSDAQKKLDDYLNKKKTIVAKSQVEELEEYELEKYQFVRSSFVEMLKNYDTYKEKEWQKLVVQFMLLIYPKYVAVLEDVRIKDYYSQQGKAINRAIDLMLVDAGGNTDIIEIKRPFPNCVLSKKYRDNFTPNRELSGAVMQAEKYLFHLNKWGVVGEKVLNEKYGHELPNDLKLKVTNSKAILILGRDESFTGEQKFDFEIIKRKYANMIDIVTFDDLLRRLENIISMLQHNYSRLSVRIR